MKILVTGGTGVVGKRLVERLVKRGHEVVVFSRHAGAMPNVKYTEGDIRSVEDLRKAFPVDVVYHLAAGLGEDKESAAVNVDGTRNVVNLCSADSCKQLIFLSSSGVLGETSEPSREDMSYAPKTPYEKSKRDAEQMIRGSGVAYTILRASIIIAPNRIWQQIFGAARKGYPIIGDGKNKFHLAAVNDVVGLLLRVLDADKAKNQIFHVATADIPTYKEVYKMICDLLDVKMPEKHVSPGVAKLGLRLKGVFKKSGDVTQKTESIDRLVRNRIIDISKAKEFLSFEPKYDTRKALKETFEEMTGKSGKL